MKNNQYYEKYLEGYHIYDNKFSSDDSKKVFNYSDKTQIWEVSFFESLTDKDIYKLLKHIHSLDTTKYKVESRWIKPKSSKKFKFIYPENFSGRHGNFAEISFLQDDFINKIKISYSQRSNFMGMFQYQVSFKRNIKTLKEQHLFIKENIKYKNKTNTYNYLTNMEIEPVLKETWMKTHKFYFDDVLQTRVIYSLFGNRAEYFELMMLEYIAGYKNLDRVNDKKIFKTHMAYVAFHKKQDVVLYISTIFEDVPKIQLLGNSNFPIIRLLPLFARYRNIFYYSLFLKHENSILTSKTSASSGIIQDYKTFNWLINKNNELTNSRDNVDEEELINLKKELQEDWDFIPTSLSPFIDIFSKQRYEYMKNIYEENLQMYKTKVDVKNSIINLLFGTIALVLSIIAIIISIVI